MVGTLMEEGERPSGAPSLAKLEPNVPQRRRLRGHVKRGAGATQCLPHEPDGRSNEVLQNLALSSGKALGLVRLRRVPLEQFE